MAVVGCLFLDISVGEFNLLAFIYPYFSSYFHSYDPSITPASMVLLPSLWLLAYTTVCPLSIVMYNRLGFKLTFLLLVCIFFAGQLLSALISNFYLFSLVYSVFGGSAQGGLAILPMYCCWRYFPESKKSIISGIILSAYALAPIGTSIIALKIINPDNVSPTKDGEFSYFGPEVYMNVPRFLRTFGVFCFCLGIVGILMIMEPIPEEEDNINMVELLEGSPNSRTMERDSNYKLVAHYEIHNVTWDDVRFFFYDSDFRKMYLLLFIGFLYPNFLIFNFKQIGLEKLSNPDRYLNYIGGVASLFNAGSRLVLGMVFQHVGIKAAVGTTIFITVTSAFTFLFLASNKVTYGLSLCYFYICYGGQLGIYPLLASSVFRAKGALAYSLLFSGFTFSCLLVSFLHSWLTKLVGLNTVMITLGLVSLIPVPWVRQLSDTIMVKHSLV